MSSNSRASSLAAGLDQPPVVDDVDHIGHHVVEQPLVVGHQDDGALGAAEQVDAVGHDLQGVDVQAGIGLVQDRQGGLQHGHLEDLGALFLAAGEARVDRTPQQVLAHLHRLHLLLGQGHEVHRVQLVLAAVGARRIDRRAQEVEAVEARDLHRVLKAQEDTLHRPQLRRHLQQVPILVEDLPLGNLVGVPPGQHLRQRALARAVWGP